MTMAIAAADNSWGHQLVAIVIARKIIYILSPQGWPSRIVVADRLAGHRHTGPTPTLMKTVIAVTALVMAHATRLAAR